MDVARSAIWPSEYASQLAKGFPLLRFDGELEQVFRRAQLHDFMPRLRVIIVASVLLYVIPAIPDYFVLAHDAWLQAWVPRLAVVTVSLVTLALTRTRIGTSALMAWIMVSVLVAGTGLAMLAVMLAGAGVTSYFGWLALLTVFVYFMTGLLLRQAGSCALLLAVFTLLAAWISGLHPALWGYILTSLVLANGIGLLGAYSLEHSVRTSFLQKRLLGEMADRDALTGVYNRRCFQQMAHATFAQARREHQSLVMTMVDVDRFKSYNDRYGHPEGDCCLRAVAAALLRHAQRPLDVVARYGGEEFVLLWYAMDFDAARRHCEAMRREIEALVPSLAPDGLRSPVTVSVGAAVAVPAGLCDMDAFIAAADNALYAAKREGRNRCVVRPITVTTD